MYDKTIIVSIPRFKAALLSALLPFAAIAAASCQNTQPAERTRGYKVAQLNGAPAIFFEGKPIVANAYFNCTWDPKHVTGEEMRKMLGAGVHIHYLGAALDWRDEFSSGGVDAAGGPFRSTDARIQEILKVDPEARFLLNVHTFLPKSWAEKHPGELPCAENGTPFKENSKYRVPNSFASQLWKEAVGERMVDMISFLKGRGYYDRIIGFQAFVGWEGQWTWWSPAQECYDDKNLWRSICESYDHSPAMTSYFRNWTRAKYSGDTQRLRDAWGDPNASFDSLLVPAETQLKETDFHIFKDMANPRTKYVNDYLSAYQQARLDALLHWGRKIKEATKDNPKLYGSYYASILHNAIGGTSNLLKHPAGYEAVCDSPYIDFFSATSNYPTRGVGGDAPSNLLVDSLLLHGKFLFYEQDQPTHLSLDRRDQGEEGELAVPRNLQETLSMLKRNFAYTLCKGRTGEWWWDQETSDKIAMRPARFDSPEIWSLFAQMSKISEESLDQNCSSVSEIAVFYDEGTPLHLAPQWNGPGRNVVVKQIMPLGRIGAPYDIYALDDVAKTRPYKMYVMLNAFHLSDAQRQAIERIKRGNALVLWIYAPGFSGDGGLSVDAMSKLIGIRMRMLDKEGILETRIVNAQDPMTLGLAGKTLGVTCFPGTSKEYHEKTGPLFSVDDPEARTLGVYVENGLPGFASKKLGEWESVYLGFYPIPSGLLRSMAIHAGVHIYDSQDDVLYANASYLAIHSDKPGTRRIKLPVRATVVDLFGNTCLVKDARSFSVEMDGMDTKLFLLKK